MDARDRFVTALAETVSAAYYTDGDIFLSVERIEAIAREQQVPEVEARAALRLLDDRGLLQRQERGWNYGNGIGLLLSYEEANRRLFWQRNELRQEILQLAAMAYDSDEGDLAYYEGTEQFVDAPWAEAYAASLTLEYLGLVEVRPFMGHNFRVEITAAGHELRRDAQQLTRELPVNAAEDEAATADVAHDSMRDLILDVERLLAQRGWHGAARELGRGDAQYRDGHWTDSVREYYAALESGLKHRLDEEAVTHGEGAGLRDLSRLAATHNLMPTNYQALFGFADSIRSPRSHGAGAKAIEIEVGKAEALLMGNHIRALLLYLGQRPA